MRDLASFSRASRVSDSSARSRSFSARRCTRVGEAAAFCGDTLRLGESDLCDADGIDTGDKKWLSASSRTSFTLGVLVDTFGDFVLGDDRMDLCNPAGEAGGARGDTSGPVHLLDVDAEVGLRSRGDTDGLLLLALVGRVLARGEIVISRRGLGVFADVGADLLIARQFYFVQQEQLCLCLSDCVCAYVRAAAERRGGQSRTLAATHCYNPTGR